MAPQFRRSVFKRRTASGKSLKFTESRKNSGFNALQSIRLGVVRTSGSCNAASVEEVGQARDEAVTVGRVREALEKVFGGVLGLGQGRGRSRVVEMVSPDCL
jgi:hypothetical protein